MLYFTVTLTLLCNFALAAHFLRESHPIAMALTLAGSALLFARRPSTILLNQVALTGGMLLWLGTAGEILSKRLSEGKPFERMLAIMCTVAALSLLAAVLWALPRVRRRWLRLP